MGKKNPSTLTLPLSDKEIQQIRKIQAIFGEKTMAGALRCAIDSFPGKCDQIDILEKELHRVTEILEVKEAAINVIIGNEKK